MSGDGYIGVPPVAPVLRCRVGARGLLFGAAIVATSIAISGFVAWNIESRMAYGVCDGGLPREAAPCIAALQQALTMAYEFFEIGVLSTVSAVVLWVIALRRS
jgi:hypothetical protein